MIYNTKNESEAARLTDRVQSLISKGSIVDLTEKRLSEVQVRTLAKTAIYT